MVQYQKVAEQGYANAQCNLGACYSYGTGVEKDEQKAVEWFKKAAEQGYAYGQYNLGWCYEKGVGVKQDEQKAVELYEKAAEQGYVKAQNKVYFFTYYDSSKLKKTVQELTEFYQMKKKQS